jgi:hypothetical protein
MVADQNDESTPEWFVLSLLMPVWFPPIWDSESERIGKRKCTPVGAMLHTVSNLIGLASLISLPAVLVTLAVEVVKGTIQGRSLWLLLVPYAFTNLARLIYGYSWKLAERKGFEYGDDRVASWMEIGIGRSFKYEGSKSRQ